MRFKQSKSTKSYALSPDFSVTLSRLFKINESLKDNQSRFLTLHNNDEALAWRVGLIEKAEKTIDAQYYSWHADTSGKLLIKKLIEAADRGVRVRLLLDDIHTFGADRKIAILNQHKNIEVRLFNTFHFRWSYKPLWFFEFLWDLNRLNRRMHNKLLIADSVVSIIGGRNIGDEYYGLCSDLVFRDLDLMVCGYPANNFSSSFDQYWNSPISKQARRIIAFRPRRLDFLRMKKKLDKNVTLNSPIVQRIEDLKNSLLANSAITESLTVSESQVFYDPPEPHDDEQNRMVQKLIQCGNDAVKQITIISAYFVPTENMMIAMRNLVNKGISIQIFTNSLASIDVTLVFSGYERYRHQLLSMGVALYEFRADPEFHSIYSTPAVNVKHFSLHAKSIIYDASSVYVGTFNLDPRSAAINTEVGVLVNNSTLSDNVRNAFLKDLAEGQFWQVTFNDKGRLTWSCGSNSTNIQPARNLLQRILNFFYSYLPIHQHL